MIAYLKGKYWVKFLPRLIKPFSTWLSIGFVLYTVFINFEKLSFYSFSKGTISCLVLSFLVSTLSLVVNGFAWKQLLIWLGYNNKNFKIVSLFLKTNLLKYLPGGVWHFVERFRCLSSTVSSEKAFTAVVLEPFVMLAAALSLITIFNPTNFYYYIFILPSILLARRFRGSLLIQLAAMKLLKFEGFRQKNSLNKETILSNFPLSFYPWKSFLTEILFIIIRFAGFWFCLSSFSVDHYLSLSKWISLFCIAWSAGLVVPSAPGGVGIFESIVLLLYTDMIPQELIILSLISYRLVVSLADISLPLVFVIAKIKLPYNFNK